MSFAAGALMLILDIFSLKIDIYRPRAVRAEVVPSGVGELTPVESDPP